MRKLLITVFAMLAGVVLFAAPAMADSTVSVNIEQPQTPTNQRSFNVNFVALTTTSNAITVKCFKKGPADAAFSQFGSDITLSSGGNTSDCPVTSDMTATDGQYSFYVTATDTSSTVTSNTVTVTVDTSYPDAPTGYAKSQIDSCTYKIHFHTASDNGKTVSVEVYRSDSKTFNADSGTRVTTIAIGSNADYNFTNSVPDCSKYYYYVIRAFNAAGNGSGIVGDSEVNIVTNTVITPKPTQNAGAIPVSSNNVTNGNQSVLGTQSADENKDATHQTQKDVLGTNQIGDAIHTATSHKKISAVIAFGILIVLAVLYAMWRRMQKAKETATLKKTRKFEK